MPSHRLSDWNTRGHRTLAGGKGLSKNALTARANALSQDFSASVHLSNRQGDVMLSVPTGSMTKDPITIAKRAAIKAPEKIAEFDTRMMIKRLIRIPE